MQNLFEIWKPIIGYEGRYEVSNLGRVKSLPKSWINYNGSLAKHPEKILKLRLNKRGYARVNLRDGVSSKDRLVHRLVAQAFIPNPLNLPEINHKDENPSNNIVYINLDGSIDVSKSNLEWCTHIYNNQYGTKNRRGALRRGFVVSQYDLQGRYICTYPTIRDAERATGIYMNLISDCANGIRKQGGGFIWKHEKGILATKVVSVGKGECLIEQERKSLTKYAYCYKNDSNYIIRIDAIKKIGISPTIFDSYIEKIGYDSIKTGGFRFYKRIDIEELYEALIGIPRNKSKEKMNVINRLINKHKV